MEHFQESPKVVLDLGEIFSRYPSLSLARPEQNAEILSYFERSTMEGSGLSLWYDRTPNFFSFLKDQSDTYFVVLARGRNDVLRGLGSLIIRPGYINGRKTTVGYLGDLRMKLDRRVAGDWRGWVGDIAKHKSQIRELNGCEGILTAIMDRNENARRNLLSKAALPFRYDPLISYRMQNLLWRKPWSKLRLLKDRTKGTGETIEAGGSLEELILFLDQDAKSRPYGYVYDSELPRRLRTWENFSLGDFITIRSGDKIVATTALWAPKTSKRIIINKVSAPVGIGLKALSAATNRTLEVGEPLEVLYLTHLAVADGSADDRQRWFQLLVEAAWEKAIARRAAFLSHCDFVNEPLGKSLKGFVSVFEPMTLFEVNDKTVEPQHVIHKNAGFEMCLV
jgi:hypothetical protein